MKIEIYWYDEEQTILAFKFLNGYTWDDLSQAMAQGQVLMTQKPYQVDWLYHSDGDRQNIPRGNPWHILRAASQKIPANTGLLCVVNPGMFVKLMQRIGESTIPESMKLMRTAPTLEEGVKLLYKERENRQNVT